MNAAVIIDELEIRHRALEHLGAKISRMPAKRQRRPNQDFIGCNSIGIAINYVLVRRRLAAKKSEANKEKTDIYESDHITIPFIPIIQSERLKFTIE